MKTLERIEDQARELLEEVGYLISQRERPSEGQSSEPINMDRIRINGGYLIHRKPLPD